MPNTPYQYKPGDSVLRLANEYQLTPQQIINANPGGYPFSTGQTISLPITPRPLNQPTYQYGSSAVQNIFSPANPGRNVQGGGNMTSPLVTTPGRNVMGGWSYQTPTAQYTPNNYNVNMRGRGYGQPQRGVVPDNVGNQAFYQQELTDVMNSPDKPVSMSSYTMQSLVKNGFDPTANGYVYQNGQWVQAGSPAESTTTGGGGGEQSYNPKNIAYTWNRNAKNPKSRFETNLKWAQNAWKRKRTAGKRWNSQPQGQMNQNISGFGLVDFSASSG